MDIAGSALGAWGGGGVGFLFALIVAHTRGLGVSLVVIPHVDLPHAPKALTRHFPRDIKVFLVSVAGEIRRNSFDSTRDISKCRIQVGRCAFAAEGNRCQWLNRNMSY